MVKKADKMSRYKAKHEKNHEMFALLSKSVQVLGIHFHNVQSLFPVSCLTHA